MTGAERRVIVYDSGGVVDVDTQIIAAFIGVGVIIISQVFFDGPVAGENGSSHEAAVREG